MMINQLVFSCVLTVGLSANIAQADAWSVFHKYCLIPLEQSLLNQPTNLSATSHYKNDDDTYSEYAFDNGRILLAVSDGRLSYPQWCRVSTRKNSTRDGDEANAFLLWSVQSENEERYTEIDPETVILHRDLSNGIPLLLGSKQLQVSMNLNSKRYGIVFKAREND